MPRVDPYKNFQFRVEIGGIQQALADAHPAATNGEQLWKRPYSVRSTRNAVNESSPG